MAYRIKQLAIIICFSFVTACDDETQTSPPSNNASDLGHIHSYLEQTLTSPLVNPASCVNYSRSCSAQELPFISMSYPEPKIADIMSRVVVSHDWMGDRFSTLLTLLPKEMLTLLGSVTAIVIADNIRPSFYWTGSGAIYLDPSYLWLSNAEKATINQTPDYRDGFSSGLSYDFFHRFIKEGESAYSYHSLSGTEERDIDDIILPMASLLFHELAHANDFMPASLMASINIEKPLWSEINRFSNQQLNEQLKQSYPISDATLKAQAAILYSGKVATDEQKSQSASYLGLLFEQEGSNHLYSYSHDAEDVAMLFQATMLNYYYGIEMDSAFVIQPTTDSVSCSDYIVAWGQRNRIADPSTKPRAQFVSQQLLEQLDFTAFFNDLADAQNFPPLTDWCNRSLAQDISVRRSSQAPFKIINKDHHHGAITVTQ